MQLERDSLYAGFTKKADQQTLPAEIANRNRFAIAQAWLKPLIGFVREGFKGYSPTVEGFVAAKSFLLRNAIEGEYPDYIINPAKMKLSYGDLPMAADPAVAYQADTNELVFCLGSGYTRRGIQSGPGDAVGLFCIGIQGDLHDNGCFQKNWYR